MQPTTSKSYIELLNHIPGLWWLLGISPCLIIFSAWVPYLAPLWFITVFCWFDVIGYHILVQEGAEPFWKLLTSTGKSLQEQMAAIRILPAYRLLQVSFQIALLALIGFAFAGDEGFNWKLSGAAAILHWTGNQDLLYYLALWTRLPEQWTWMSWTPLGIVLTMGQQENERDSPVSISNFWIVTQAIIGITIAVGILW